MKKEFLLTVASGLLFSSSALAQSCASTPKCETLGFTETEADCAGGKMLKCPFDLSKIFCYHGGGDGLSGAKPGDIYYSDGTVSEDVIAGKTPVGIVAYNDGSTRFVVALEEASKTWGGYGYDVACLSNITGSAYLDYQGKVNTQCLLSDTVSHPAAEYCNSYKAVSSGKGASGWYLPAAGELYAMSFSYGAINLGLEKLTKTKISSGWYWSSSEIHSDYAWGVRPSDSLLTGSDYGDKNHRYPVRCVLAF